MKKEKIVRKLSLIRATNASIFNAPPHPTRTTSALLDSAFTVMVFLNELESL